MELEFPYQLTDKVRDACTIKFAEDQLKKYGKTVNVDYIYLYEEPYVALYTKGDALNKQDPQDEQAELRRAGLLPKNNAYVKGGINYAK